MVLSSRGNKYLNCPWGLKEEVLVESFRNRLGVDGGVEEGGLFATGAGTFGGVADLDCMALITGKTGLSSWHLNAVKSDLLPFVLSIILESGPSIGDVHLKIRISKGRVQLFVQILINRSHEDQRFDV